MKKILIILACAVSLSACGIYNKYERPAEITGEQLYGSDITENADSATLATLSWKELFTDPHLQTLIARALEQNADLQSLELAIQQAEAGYRMSKLAYVPGFAFAPQGGYNANNIPGWSYALPIAMDWEFDIFGRLTNQKRKAKAALLMTQDVQQAAQTQIVATVASLYYQLLSMDAQLLLTDSTARKWRETVRVMQLMKEAGMMNEVSVAQTEATCFAIEAGLLDLKRGIRDVENALCVILKQSPQTIERSNYLYPLWGKNNPHGQSPLLQEGQGGGLVGVSAQLLANRPDVRQAERNLEQYFYNVNYARSQFYPSIKILGSVMWGGGFIHSLLGSLVQPIFAHGAIKGNLDIAKAQYQQALLAFEQKLIEAGTEVNDALRQCLTAREKQTLRTEQIASLEKAMLHTESLMTNGHTTYLEVIYAQQSLLDAQTQQIADWLEESQSLIRLYQSLGGGTH